MASRYHSAFREKKISAPRGPAPGPPGSRGATVRETVANWPDPGPHGPAAFNRVTKMPVVKIEARKRGLP